MSFDLSSIGRFTRNAMRVACFGTLFLFSMIIVPPHSLAHEGHDHGEKKPESTVAVGGPRFAVESSLFQLVGQANGKKLTLYLDRFDNNSPIEGALIDITAGVDNQIAEEVSPGTYALSADWVAKSGTHDLIVSITANDDADLILAQLVVPETEVIANDHALAWWKIYLPAATHAYISPVLTPIGAFLSKVHNSYLFIGVFSAGLVLGLLLRNKAFPVLSAIIALCLVSLSTPVTAHEGHDHGDEKTPLVQTGNQPQRLADGSVFLPKPTQRLLNIRSEVVKFSDTPKTQRLLGKTISDPAFRSVVQAVRDGRIGFPPSGLPTIGEIVNSGDRVATLTPVLTLEAQAGMAEQLGALTQELAITQQRLARLQAASEVQVAGQSGIGLSAVSRGSIEELEVQLNALTSRRDALKAISFGPLDLEASRSGTIANVNVTAGQVVAAGDTVMEIVDPKRVWVEAIAYPGQWTDFTSNARALLPKNDIVPITYITRSLSLTAQAETLYFRLQKEEIVPLGTPVTVILEGEKKERSLLIPRNAVVRGASGLLVVWVQEAPETFRPQIIDAEPVDGTLMKIKAGLTEDDRFVAEGASFLNQVR
ncbi:MAG: HlyD family efflux transporter periplasmic adaptor subunit [Rhizobiales bacterium]|nr:HlyD family efflux transporter periplasmic adaptor subunit [Hyphomicrobiales bacterium]